MHVRSGNRRAGGAARRGRRTIWLAPLLPVLIAVALQEAPDARAAPPAPPAAKPALPLRPARRQPLAHNLLDSIPLPVVSGAARAAQRGAALPVPLSPPSPAQNQPYAYIPYRCVPRFGPGSSFDVCPLGDTRSRRVVALVGDSHAWMWIPGLVRAARILHFRLIPLTKPGCLLGVIYRNRPGWPCRAWYRRAMRTIAAIRPSATIVSFMTSNFATAQAAWAARTLEGLLLRLPHRILIADPPNYNWYTHSSQTPAACLASAAATRRSCARPETPQVRVILGAIQRMTLRARIPTIPTLQWFCADGICPAVIDRTVTSEDGSHITSQYSRLLGPLLAAQLRPILDATWSRESSPTGAVHRHEPGRSGGSRAERAGTARPGHSGTTGGS